jgi:hypothetical protein
MISAKSDRCSLRAPEEVVVGLQCSMASRHLFHTCVLDRTFADVWAQEDRNECAAEVEIGQSLLVL